MIAIVFGACQSPKEKALEQIKLLEANDSVFSPQRIEKLKKSYLDFAAKYADDDLAPEFLFKAAQSCNATANHQEAILILNKLMAAYANHRIAEEALFLQAYIYENSMQDYVNAKATYQLFMTKYPHSEMAEDAKLSIANLGKSPEEIFNGFQSQQMDSVVAASAN